MSMTEAQNNAVPPFQRSMEDVLASLQSNATHGLSEAEAKARLEKHGRNELAAEEPDPWWKRFLAQFGDVLVILLLVASAISVGLWAIEGMHGLPYEALAIMAIVLLNAILGYVQEARAESAVAALKAMTATEATVVRDGRRQKVPAAELVPGDIVLIAEGNSIPADARVIKSVALQVAEAALTGESVPVEKEIGPIEGDVGLGDRTNMVYSGTAATYGHGKAVIVATGMQTEMGRIAGMMQQTEVEHTPLQEELDRLGKILGIVVIGIAIVMIGTILAVEEVKSLSAVFEVLILGVALAVAAVPEGLPAIVTAVLAIGVQRMAKKHAIVRHLASVETLGSASVIASDKTGTLTKNEMTVRAVVTASGRVNFAGTGYAPTGEVTTGDGKPLEGALRDEIVRTLIVADRANNASLHESSGRWSVQGDPTEGALLVAARKVGLEDHELDMRFERQGEIPFSSERKLMSTLHSDSEDAGRGWVFSKGAADILLSHCTHELVGSEVRALTDARRADILKAAEELAGNALRTLGMAQRQITNAETSVPEGAKPDEQLEYEETFLGLVGMIDPPREEAKAAVARAKGAGVRSIMITGDHPKTAAVIANELGIIDDGRAVTGHELAKMSDEELAKTVREVSVYARVDPEHKLRIVRALQSRTGGDATVAMTGDGVNDAPALKASNIGVAMGITGTDVSKQAADVILTDDNFATIVAAVEGGRAIYANIRKFIRYLLSSNIGEVMTMFFGVLFAKVIGLTPDDDAHNGLILPLLATQILWINLVTDGAPAIALGVDPPDPDLMDTKPRPRHERVITFGMWVGIVLVGAIMGIGTLLVLDAGLPGGLIEGDGSLRYAQTMAFTTLMFFQLFNVFNARSDTQSAFVGLFSNIWLWVAVGISLVLNVCVIYMPFLQTAFSTVPLSGSDWALCIAVSSTVLWLREISKVVVRATAK